MTAACFGRQRACGNTCSAACSCARTASAGSTTAIGEPVLESSSRNSTYSSPKVSCHSPRQIFGACGPAGFRELTASKRPSAAQGRIVHKVPVPCRVKDSMQSNGSERSEHLISKRHSS